MIEEKIINFLKIDYDVHQYIINKEYVDIVSKYSFFIKETDYFFQTYYENNKKNKIPEFGWKIHISSTLVNADIILDIVSDYCDKNKVTFKFLKDSKLLSKSSSKNFSRSGSGKFITIYPSNFQAFKRIIEDLYALLREYEGPFVLSDKRYKDCKVLYYRFGRMAVTKQTPKDSQGEAIFKGPDNLYFVDIPQPYYQKPTWIPDPFPEKIEDNNTLGIKNGRYSINEVLNISNSGGIYKAFDNILKRNVILKEARPGTVPLSNGMDAVDLRQIEYFVLKEGFDKNISSIPMVFDEFFEWEHYFISVEEIKGKTLREIFNEARLDKFNIEYLNLFKQLLLSLNELHSQNITVGDISLDNIILNKDGEIKFIDFELANSFNYRNEAVLLMGTHECRYHNYDSLKDRFKMDLESLGIVMLNYFIDTKSLFSLDKGKIKETVSFCYKNNIISNEIKFLLENIIFNSEIISIPEIIEILNEINIETYIKSSTSINFSKIKNNIAIELNDIKDILEKEYFSENNDFLVSKDIPDFLKGKLGIALTIQEINTALNNNENIILNYKDISYRTLDSLYIKSEINSSFIHDELSSIYNSLKGEYYIRNGLSGIGLILIKNQEYYLSLKIGNEISDIILKREYRNLCGSTEEYGFFNGLSGIAYFLSELHIVTKTQKFLNAAQQLIDYIILKANTGDVGILVSDAEKSYTNNGLLGLSGLGMAISSFLISKDHPKYKKYLDDLTKKVLKDYSVNHSLGTGVSGIILLLIHVMKNHNFKLSLKDIILLLKVLKLYKVSFRGKSYYLNQNNSIIDNSFYSGSAGVGFMLSKLYILLKENVHEEFSEAK